MKRKGYIAVLAMCMALAAAGCGDEDKAKESSTGTTETQQEVENQEAESQEPEEKDPEGGTRLVSVDSVEKYITIGEYKGMVLDNTVEEVTDEDVENQVLQNLKEKAEEVTAKSASVETGDTVTINFVGTKDGVAFEGGTANNYDVTIGDGKMIPGFEDGIIGMKIGETKEVPVTFPENYQKAEMAGVEAVFQITLQNFRRPPELTDEWAAANTDFGTAEEYRASVRSQLETSAQAQAESSLRTTAWTTVYTNSEVMEYPQEDIDNAVAEFKRQAQSYAQQGNMELEDFVESQGVSMEDFEEQCLQYAQAKVKQDLIIQGIMDAEGMTLEDEESLAIQDQLVQQYGAGDLATLIDTYGQEAVDESIGLVRVENFIIANASFEQGDAEQAADAAGEGDGTQADAAAEGDAVQTDAATEGETVPAEGGDAQTDVGEAAQGDNAGEGETPQADPAAESGDAQADSTDTQQ